MAGVRGPTVTLQMPASSLAIGAGGNVSIATTDTALASGALRRKVTVPSAFTSGDIGLKKSCASTPGGVHQAAPTTSTAKHVRMTPSRIPPPVMIDASASILHLDRASRSRVA